MYEKIKRFYELKLYTGSQVYKFVEKGIITESQYNSIIND